MSSDRVSLLRTLTVWLAMGSLTLPLLAAPAQAAPPNPGATAAQSTGRAARSRIAQRANAAPKVSMREAPSEGTSDPEQGDALDEARAAAERERERQQRIALENALARPVPKPGERDAGSVSPFTAMHPRQPAASESEGPGAASAQALRQRWQAGAVGQGVPDLARLEPVTTHASPPGGARADFSELEAAASRTPDISDLFEPMVAGRGLPSVADGLTDAQNEHCSETGYCNGVEPPTDPDPPVFRHVVNGSGGQQLYECVEHCAENGFSGGLVNGDDLPEDAEIAEGSETVGAEHTRRTAGAAADAAAETAKTVVTALACANPLAATTCMAALAVLDSDADEDDEGEGEEDAGEAAAGSENDAGTGEEGSEGTDAGGDPGPFGSDRVECGDYDTELLRAHCRMRERQVEDLTPRDVGPGNVDPVEHEGTGSGTGAGESSRGKLVDSVEGMTGDSAATGGGESGCGTDRNEGAIDYGPDHVENEIGCDQELPSLAGGPLANPAADDASKSARGPRRVGGDEQGEAPVAIGANAPRGAVR